MSVTKGCAAVATKDDASAVVARVDDGREAVVVGSWKKLAPDSKGIADDFAS